jgi:2-succinyl-6-hydroxy-2,4-cyclohexadiene-1-carboxylate synthase
MPGRNRGGGRVNVFALHGFLGTGDDFQPLVHRLADFKVSLRWHCPEYLRKGSPFSLNNCADLAEQMNREAETCKGSRKLLGYSLGGRIALHMFEQRPDLWDEVILLSTHLGLSEASDQRDRLLRDETWADQFLNESWTSLISKWNDQEVFRADFADFAPVEEDFDRGALAAALKDLSLGRQRLWTRLKDRLHTDKITAFVGGEDKKFLGLYEEWKLKGLIKDFKVQQGQGHRLLKEPGHELVTYLVERWKL